MRSSLSCLLIAAIALAACEWKFTEMADLHQPEVRQDLAQHGSAMADLSTPTGMKSGDLASVPDDMAPEADMTLPSNDCTRPGNKTVGFCGFVCTGAGCTFQQTTDKLTFKGSTTAQSSCRCVHDYNRPTKTDPPIAGDADLQMFAKADYALFSPNSALVIEYCDDSAAGNCYQVQSYNTTSPLTYLTPHAGVNPGRRFVSIRLATDCRNGCIEQDESNIYSLIIENQADWPSEILCSL